MRGEGGGTSHTARSEGASVAANFQSRPHGGIPYGQLGGYEIRGPTALEADSASTRGEANAK